MNDLPLAVALGAVAIVLAWLLVQAIRSGSVTSRGMTFNFSDEPVPFGLVAAMHGALVVLLGAEAVLRLGLI